MSFEIQSGVPIPRRTAGRSGSKYPFLQMDVDQMFTVDTGVKAATVRSAVGAFTKRNPGAGKNGEPQAHCGSTTVDHGDEPVRTKTPLTCNMRRVVGSMNSG